MKTVIESGMKFGEFSEEKLFLIENSKLHRSLGEGIKTVEFVFVLVIREAKDETWLAGPKEILDERLRRLRKIWKVRVVVLNPEKAIKYGIMQPENDM